MDQALIKLIEQRYIRKKRYQIASVCLVVALIAYVTTVFTFLIVA